MSQPAKSRANKSTRDADKQRFLHRLLPRFVLNLVLIIIAVSMLFPVIFMVSGSFKSAQEVSQENPTLLPSDFTAENYTKVFEAMPFGRYYLNSIIVAVSRTLIVLFTSSLFGYVFAKHTFWGKNVLFITLLSTMMMPFVVVLVPLFLVVSYLGLADTYTGLILPGSISIFGLFLMRQNIQEIPNDLIESAKIDGAAEWWIYLRIILPLVKPALAALGIFTFMWNWNDFVWPLVITISENMRTLPLGIAQFQTEHSINYSLTITAATISMLPVLVVFLFAQKQFIKGMTMSGLKG